MSSSATILVIEDEESIRMPLVDRLEAAGHRVLQATDGPTGRELALREGPDLILLDLMLPGLDGLALLRALRADRLTCPVLIITARGEEWDRVQGFQAGADDYVVKPFSSKELLLRVEALLRRAGGVAPGIEPPPPQEHFGSVTVDFEGYAVTNRGVTHELARLELELLRFFLEHEGRVLDRNTLLRRVWGEDAFPTTRTVDTHVLKLRKKIEQDPERPVHLLTVRGVGYKFMRG